MHGSVLETSRPRSGWPTQLSLGSALSMTEPEHDKPEYRRWHDAEAVIGQWFPTLTADAPYWQHLPRAEIVSDPNHPRGLGLRLLTGDVPADVLTAAADLLVLAEHAVGVVVGINHNPVTGYLSIEEYGEAPAYDAAHISPWDVVSRLTEGLHEPGTLEGLAAKVEANAAAVAATLRSFTAAGLGLADLDLPYVAVSEIGWPADANVTVITGEGTSTTAE